MPAIRPPRLSDGEVTLRGLAPSDIPALVAACRDPEITRWTRVPSPYLREDAERFLAINATESAAGEGVALAVTVEGDDRLVGTVGLMDLRGESGEIGYWIAAGARGRGAAARAVRLVCAWAHSELGVSRFEILAHRDNEPSQRVARSAGFAETGEVRSLARMPPGRRDGYKVFARRAAAPG